MSRARGLVIVGTVGLLFAFVGCSSGEKAEGKKPATTTTAVSDCVVADSLPENAPEGAAEATTTSIVQKCLDDAFVAAVSGNGSKALKDLSKDQVLGFGHGLCAYAQSLAVDPARSPTYAELIKSTSESWGVQASVVEEMIGFAGTLCPNQLAPILALKKEVGTVMITFEGTGSGALTVSYTGPDGVAVDSVVQTPWTTSVRFDEPTDIRLSVSAEGGGASCTIKANDHQVTTANGKDDAPAECSVTATDIREAAD